MVSDKKNREGGLSLKGVSKRNSTDEPLVSIITVVYNGEDHIEQTIKSVLNQSYKNIEYIIIDGASTDNTLSIIQRYNDQIDHWISELDKGLYYGINKAINLAKGEIIGILNSGDFYLQNTLKLVVEANKKNDSDLFYGNWMWITENDTSCSFNEMRSDIKQMNNKQSIGHPTCFVKKKVYENIGLFNTDYKLAGDYDFLLRCMNSNVKFQQISQILVACAPLGLSNSYKSDFESFKIQRTHGIPNPYKYIYRGLKSYSKKFIRNFLPI